MIDPRSLIRTCRVLLRHPRYAAACIGSLALAVAAATTTLAVARRAFIDALPYSSGESLVALYTSSASMQTSPVSAHVLEELRASGVQLSQYTAFRPGATAFTHEGSTEQLIGVRVTNEFFTTIGRPVIGQPWGPDDPDAVLISWSLWQRVFGGADDVVGARMTLDGETHYVAGVLSKDMVVPYWSAADLIRPLDLRPLLEEPRTRRQLTIIAVRPPDVELSALDAQLAAFTQRIHDEMPELHGRDSWIARPLRDEMIGPARPALLGTAAAAVLLLLIAGANIGSLSAVRAVALRQQFAVRGALGANRARLLRERFEEGVIIAAGGTVLGLAVAPALVRAAAGLQSQFLFRMAPVTLDARTVLAGAAAGLATGLIASVLPYVPILKASLTGPGSARGATSSSALAATRSTLVVVQVAVALVLIIGAGLLVRTVHNLSATPLGFRTEGLTMFQVNMPGARYQSDDAQLMFERSVLERLRSLPNVVDATASVGIPVSGGMRAGLTIEGRSDALDEVAYFSVASSYMDFFDIPVVAGRSLTDGDIAGAPPVMLINESLARRSWPEGNALGARIYVGPGAPSADDGWMTVVGIVADSYHHGVVEGVIPTAFGSTLQYTWPRRHFTIMTRGVPPTAEQLREQVAAVDPAAPIGVVRTFDELVTEQTARYELLMMTLTFFGAVATALCALGLYSVIALAARMRRREYAIRMSLGAAPMTLHNLVLRQGFVLAAMGAATGIVIAATGTRVLRGLLYGVQPLDGTTFGAAIVAVLTLAVLAAWLPARSASRVDPALTLRSD